jgi:DNA-binding CsgD family transcriptional regulator
MKTSRSAQEGLAMEQNPWHDPRKKRADNKSSSGKPSGGGQNPQEPVLPTPFDAVNPFSLAALQTSAAPGGHRGRSRLFISFQTQDEASGTAVEEIIQRLAEHHEVFVDRNARIGLNWASQIEAELRRADCLITFLNSRAIRSEMVEAEIATAYKLSKEKGGGYGKPRILPVRVANRDKFSYPLSVYLEGLNEAYWQGPQDTPDLVKALLKAIGGETLNYPDPETEGSSNKGSLMSPAPLLQPITVPSPSSPQTLISAVYPAPLPFAQPPRLELPEGTMDPQSFFYIERLTDRIALETIQGQGVTITIKGPRQMGKSSLLLRVREAAVSMGKRVALLDFQLFDKAALSEPELFFRQFCEWLTDELEMESRVEEYWKMPLGNSQRTTRYLQRYLLKELNTPLVLAMDEVESTFDTNFRSDFFGMLRSWHNSRQANSHWKQLDLVLVTSTEPYQLIENLNQSPFNVGEVIELEDFTPTQVAELNRRHGSPFPAPEERELVSLLAGHPYLVRRALYLVASGRLTPAELYRTATGDRGPFGDHLRHHLFRLNSKPDLIEGMRQVIRFHTCPNETVFFRLYGAGLVKREERSVVPRCQLYGFYFQQKFLEKPATGTATTELESSGGRVASPDTPHTTVSIPLNPNPVLVPATIEGLSEREIEVLKLVAAGLSNLHIAEKLFLSPHTINRHLTSVYSKIGVGSRTEAARYAHEHGLL